MSNATILGSSETRQVLVNIMDGLERRPALPGGAAGEALDAHLMRLIASLDQPLADVTQPIDEPPPRSIAVAIALTLFSQPHMVATLDVDHPTHPTRPPPRPLSVPMDIVSDVLGLATWELDELQAEIDRRVAFYLKQLRAQRWLQQHFGLPNAGARNLFSVLFPAIDPDGVGPVDMISQGAQVYAVIDQPHPPRSDALYIAWLDRRHGWAPCGTFQGRYVDRSLREQLGRAIGADDNEVNLLLERMISVVPRNKLAHFLSMDRWRTMPFDASTGLVGSYTRAAWLASELEPGEVDFGGWLKRREGQVSIENGKALFDTIALTRVCLAARQLHAHSLSTILNRGERATVQTPDELVRYDARGHLRTAMAPLLAWAKSEATVKHVANKLGVETGPARDALSTLHQQWTLHLDTTWSAIPRSGTASVAARLCAHLIRTRASIGRHYERGCANHYEHRDALMLFAAHYFAEAPLDRLWSRGTDGLAEDPIGTWFWPVWLRLTQGIDSDFSADVTFQL